MSSWARLVVFSNVGRVTSYFSYASRVIAHFVPNVVAMATGVGQGKCGWQHSMAHFRKPAYRRKNLAKISYASRVIANFVPNFVAMSTSGRKKTRKKNGEGKGEWKKEGKGQRKKEKRKKRRGRGRGKRRESRRGRGRKRWFYTLSNAAMGSIKQTIIRRKKGNNSSLSHLSYIF